MRAAILAVVLAAGSDAGIAGDPWLPEWWQAGSVTTGLPSQIRLSGGEPRDAGFFVSGALRITPAVVWMEPNSPRERLRIVEDGGVLHVYGGPDVVFHRVDGGTP